MICLFGPTKVQLYGDISAALLWRMPKSSSWPADPHRKEQRVTDLDNLIAHSFLVIGNIVKKCGFN